MATKKKVPAKTKRPRTRQRSGSDLRQTRRQIRANHEELLKPKPLPDAEQRLTRMGRPQVPIDWTKFETMCGDWATLKEIAATFNCDQDTIERHVRARYGSTFADISGEFRAARVGSLRRAAFIVALKGNATMLKHLLNNYGGTSDIFRLRSAEEARETLAELLGVAVEDLPPNAGAF